MITGPIGIFLNTMTRFWWILPLNIAIVLFFKTQSLQASVELAQSETRNIKAMAQLAKEQYDQRVEELQAEHAGSQALAELNYEKKNAELIGRANTATADVDRLRGQLAVATSASNRQARATDPATCVGAINALDTLGKLVGEGVGLLNEARGILDRRDADVQRLLDQVTADRKACQAPTAVQSSL